MCRAVAAEQANVATSNALPSDLQELIELASWELPASISNSIDDDLTQGGVDPPMLVTPLVDTVVVCKARCSQLQFASCIIINQ